MYKILYRKYSGIAKNENDFRLKSLEKFISEKGLVKRENCPHLYCGAEKKLVEYIHQNGLRAPIIFGTIKEEIQ